MLQQLSIKNYALIDSLELQLGSGLSVITGETGAGKSIILGALNLVLGTRADLKSLKDTSQKCVVEATFEVNKNDYLSFFEENDLDFEPQTIIRREILPSSKSRAFVNDTPVSLQVLRELADRLIDVHSQHHNLLIADTTYQLGLVDAFANNESERMAYTSAFQQLRDSEARLRELEQMTQTDLGDTDYLQFLSKELQEARLEEGEQQKIEAELEILEHAGEIREYLSSFLNAADGTDGQGVREGLVVQLQALRSLSRFGATYSALHERLNSLQIEFDDICQELEQQSQEGDFDPSRLEELDRRLSTLLSLQKKHQVGSESELIARREEIQQKLDGLGNLEESLSEARSKVETDRLEAEAKAQVLHHSRQKVVPGIEEQIEAILHDLNMSSAEFKIELESSDKLGISGSDLIHFSFSANKGLKRQPLAKVASGGEMSRVMLALKSTMAQKSQLPSIIFDEIDTGVSGETAGKIGNILKGMGNRMQVIAITHLPQVAGLGKEHFKVVKSAQSDSTTTNISRLNEDDRLKEVARLLSGEQISEAALANAREMLKAGV